MKSTQRHENRGCYVNNKVKKSVIKLPSKIVGFETSDGKVRIFLGCRLCDENSNSMLGERELRKTHRKSLEGSLSLKEKGKGRM